MSVEIDGRQPSRTSINALLGSVLCTSAAAMAGTTALGLQVFDLTHSELALGLLGLVEFLPSALLVLVTGSVADRFDRRRVVAVAALGEAAAAACLAWYATTSPTSATPIFGLVLLFGTFRAFVAPAARSLPADLMPAERLPWLTARFSATWQVALIVGPVLGGTLYGTTGSRSYVLMSVLAGLGGLLTLLVRTEHGGAHEVVAVIDDDHLDAAPPERASLHEAMEGLRFIRNHPVVMGAISLDLFAVLFGGAVALLPAIAEDRLGVGAAGLGWLRAAGGIGAAAVTLVLAVRPLQRHVGKVLLTAVALFGVFTIVLGVTRSFAVAFVAMMVLSGADAVSVFVRATLVPLVTPPDRRGRVLAVENVFIGASNELGAFESGVAGQVLGAPAAIALGGVATIAIAGTWWLVFPALREVDRFPRARAEGDGDVTSASPPRSDLQAELQRPKEQT
jgi:predicted MFS family arabinose efflux permease